MSFSRASLRPLFRQILAAGLTDRRDGNEITHRAKACRIERNAHQLVGFRHSLACRIGTADRQHRADVIAVLADALGNACELDAAVGIHAVVTGAILARHFTDAGVDPGLAEGICHKT